MFERVLVALNGADSEAVIAALQRLQWHPQAEAVIAHVLVNTAADPDIAADRPQADIETLPQQQLERLQAYQTQLPCK
ncbi:MAG: universal stress protein, partial [Elainella sp.]